VKGMGKKKGKKDNLKVKESLETKQGISKYKAEINCEVMQQSCSAFPSKEGCL
jgi:hypothetical protein